MDRILVSFDRDAGEYKAYIPGTDSYAHSPCKADARVKLVRELKWRGILPVTPQPGRLGGHRQTVTEISLTTRDTRQPGSCGRLYPIR